MRFLCFLFFAVFVNSSGFSALAAKPNFIVIFTDDQGYGDLGSYGAKDLDTPNIDKMAEEGIRLTDFYVAASVCTPSRASLITGSYPIKSGLTKVLFPWSSSGLNTKEVTIPRLLKKEGYTNAIVGKWHLGHRKKYSPLRHGFDYFFGVPYSHDMSPPLMRGDMVIDKSPDYSDLTQRFTEEALSFIRSNSEKPFFLYLPHILPHTPIKTSDAFKGVSKQGSYGDAIAEIDWSTGEILNLLRDLNLDKNTLVVFTSDNGPWLVKGAHGGSAGPLRGGKRSTYEGGMRVPAIFWWPGRIPGDISTDAIATTMDILPTIAKLAGVKGIENDPIIDGRDIFSVLEQTQSNSPHEAFLYYSGSHLEAIRSGNWKLHLGKKKLYDLSNDLGEDENVWSENPEVVLRLRGLAEVMDQKIKSQKRR